MIVTHDLGRRMIRRLIDGLLLDWPPDRDRKRRQGLLLHGNAVLSELLFKFLQRKGSFGSSSLVSHLDPIHVLPSGVLDLRLLLSHSRHGVPVLLEEPDVVAARLEDRALVQLHVSATVHLRLYIWGLDRLGGSLGQHEAELLDAVVDVVASSSLDYKI